MSSSNQPAGGSASNPGSGPGSYHQPYQHQASSYYHQSSTQAHSTHHHQQNQHSSASSASGGAEAFTADMRDRQARGKDPYASNSGEDVSEDDGHVHGRGRHEDDEDEGEDEELGDYDDDDHGGQGQSNRLEEGHRDEEEDYTDDDDDGDVDMGIGTRLRLRGGRLEKEDFAKAERRQKAIAFLDSPELLMMYAQSTGETLPAARLHFTRMLCGYDEETSLASAGVGGVGGSKTSSTSDRRKSTTAGGRAKK
ncbi:hypothetical protein V8F20_000228 [Naviculisporaceae sp. PSN 640]